MIRRLGDVVKVLEKAVSLKPLQGQVMASVNGVRKLTNGKENSNLDVESSRLVWIDMEMTGLDVDKDHILEIACIVTDQDLNIISEGPNLIIHQPKSLLDEMNEWCRLQHKKTGLTEASLKSNLSVQEAEERVLAFLSQHATEKMSPLAGNSVYMDRFFLIKHMPRLNEFLHYRIVDVSTVKELCRRWAPDLCKNAPKKTFRHRALDDIKESINEMKYYKDTFFKIT